MGKWIYFWNAKIVQHVKISVVDINKNKPHPIISFEQKKHLTKVSTLS